MQGRKPRKRIFLGSEGISERNYGQFLKLIADNHNLQIHIDCNYVTGGGDPLKVVQESIRLMMSNVNYFVRLASIMMAAFSVSLFHCFVASVDNYLLPV